MHTVHSSAQTVPLMAPSLAQAPSLPPLPVPSTPPVSISKFLISEAFKFSLALSSGPTLPPSPLLPSLPFPSLSGFLQ